LLLGELVNKFTISEVQTKLLQVALLYGSGRPLKMRFYGFAVAAGVLTLGACAGGEKSPADTTHVAVDTSAATTTTTTTTPGSTTPAAGGAAAAAPITGKTITVNMVGDA
jgi:hypothetical protein